MIARMRTIDEAFAYLKEKDPETALTRYYLRQLVLSGAVPSAKAGRKYLVNLDRLEEYLNHPRSGSRSPSSGKSVSFGPYRKGWAADETKRESRRGAPAGGNGAALLRGVVGLYGGPGGSDAGGVGVDGEGRGTD